MKKTMNDIIIFLCIILFIIFSILLIIANEFNFDNQIVRELKKNTVIVKDGKINKDNDNKLVFLTGKLDYNDQILHDDLCNFDIETPKLLRFVEVYQWDRYEEKDLNGNISYKYYKKWSSELIDSSKFNDHENPTTKIAGTRYYYPDSIKVGEFKLSKKQKEMLENQNKLKISDDFIIPDNYKVYKEYITNSNNPEEPEIGDNRISYYYNDWENITILAKQHKNSFKEHYLNDGNKINIIKKGILTFDEVIKPYKENSKFNKWVLRIVSIILLLFNINALISLKRKNNHNL